MLWPVVILVALMIPLTAIVLDSPVVRAWVERRQRGEVVEPSEELVDLAKKVGVLEAELESVTRQLAELQEEHQFLQRLIEDQSQRPAPRALPDASSG